MFLILLIEIFFSKIETFHIWWSFHSFSWSVHLIRRWYWKEKLDAGHYWGLKVKYQADFRPIIFASFGTTKSGKYFFIQIFFVVIYSYLYFQILNSQNTYRSPPLSSPSGIFFLFLGEISDADVEIAGGNDQPYIPGNPGLFITDIRPGSEADKLLSPGCQIAKVSYFTEILKASIMLYVVLEREWGKRASGLEGKRGRVGWGWKGEGFRQYRRVLKKLIMTVQWCLLACCFIHFLISTQHVFLSYSITSNTSVFRHFITTAAYCIAL